VSLAALAREPRLAEGLATSDTVEILIRMVEEYGAPLKLAAADLLYLLCRGTKRGRAKLIQLEGCSMALKHLQDADRALVTVMLKVLHSVSAEPSGISEIRQVRASILFF
jgi:hypothetical protein